MWVIYLSGAAVTGEVRIIDLEYGGLNYVAFDIANHFMEWSGGTDGYGGVPVGVLDFSRVPSRVQQVAFCAAYLDEQRRLAFKHSDTARAVHDGGASSTVVGDRGSGGVGDSSGGVGDRVIEDDAVEALVRDVAVFASVDNLYWGLWAVNQAKAEGSDDFPFVLYARTRLYRGLVDGGFLAG
jgi:thiamine kinase-like enzyme